MPWHLISEVKKWPWLSLSPLSTPLLCSISPIHWNISYVFICMRYIFDGIFSEVVTQTRCEQPYTSSRSYFNWKWSLFGLTAQSIPDPPHNGIIFITVTLPCIVPTAPPNHGQNSKSEWRSLHDDVIKWKSFPRYWPFVRNSPHKGQWRGALMFSLICVWINGWVINREAGDLRRFRVYYDVMVGDTDTRGIGDLRKGWDVSPTLAIMI